MKKLHKSSSIFIFSFMVYISVFNPGFTTENGEIQYPSNNHSPPVPRQEETEEVSGSFNESTPLVLQKSYDIDPLHNQEVSELIPFTLHSGTPDSIEHFMRTMDAAIFEKDYSPAELAFSFILSAAGGVASLPLTGLTLANIGDILHIPLQEEGSKCLISWIMIRSIPVFWRQMYERALIIADSVRGNTPFKFKKKADSEDNSLEPMVYETLGMHKFLKGITLVAAGVDATFYTGATLLAEEMFPDVGWGTGWAFWLVNCERSYRVATRNIDRLFVNNHDAKDDWVRLKRQYLLLQNEKFQLTLAEDDEQVETLFNRIKAKMRETSSSSTIQGQGFLFHIDDIQQNHLFYTGAFFLKNHESLAEIARKHADYQKIKDNDAAGVIILKDIIQELEKEIARLKKVNENIMTLNTLMTSQNFSHKRQEQIKDILATITSIGMTGAGAVGNLFGVEYILRNFFTHFVHLDPVTASALSWGFSSFGLIFKSVTEFDSQKMYAKSFLNTFSLKHLVHWKELRKLIGGASTVDGTFFGLIMAGAINSSLSEWNAPLSFKVLMSIAPFYLRTAFTSEHYREETENLLTAAATLRSEQKTYKNDSMIHRLFNRLHPARLYCGKTKTCEKRAFLKSKSDKITEHLKQWDASTINTLFDKVFSPATDDTANII